MPSKPVYVIMHDGNIPMYRNITGFKTEAASKLLRFQDLSRMDFGPLTVISYSHTKNRQRVWNCICICGNTCQRTTADLQKHLACGCYRRGLTTTHGLSKSREYSIYNDMLSRCNNPNSQSFSDYGGRGIRVCKEWENDFISFYDWCMRNGSKNGLELDRFPDNNGNYSPENCRFTTSKNNSNNTRRNVFVTYLGETLTVAQWCERLKLDQKVVRHRLENKNYSIDEVFNPKKLKRRKYERRN